MKRICTYLSLTAMAATPTAHAANADLQNFFFDACVNPAGLLATRCAQTPGGLGDLSADSESSLNPSQTLSRNDGSLSAAQQRAQAVRDRLHGGTGIVGYEP